MSPLAELPWRVSVGLGALALVRPVLSMSGLADDWGRPQTPIVATAAISVVWTAVAGVVRRPVETLVLAGLSYGVMALALSAVASPVLDGELRGPLAHPVAPFALLAVNAVWGAACGLAGWGLSGLRRRG